MAVALISAPSVLAQEVALEVSAFSGAFVPTSEWRFSPLFAQQAGARTAATKQKTNVLVGTRLTFWQTPLFGVEGQFAYAPSDGDVTVDSLSACDGAILGEIQSCGASVWLASLKGLYRFLPALGYRWNMHVGGGVALIRRYGDLYEDLTGTTSVGGVVDLGFVVRARREITVRLDMETYLYDVRFESKDGTRIGNTQFQTDVIFTVGVAIEVARRGEQPDLGRLLRARS